MAGSPVESEIVFFAMIALYIRCDIRMVYAQLFFVDTRITTCANYCGNMHNKVYVRVAT